MRVRVAGGRAPKEAAKTREQLDAEMEAYMLGDAKARTRRCVARRPALLLDAPSHATCAPQTAAHVKAAQAAALDADMEAYKSAKPAGGAADAAAPAADA